MLILFVIQYLQLEFQNLEFKTKQSVFSTDSTSNFLKNGIIFLSVYMQVTDIATGKNFAFLI